MDPEKIISQMSFLNQSKAYSSSSTMGSFLASFKSYIPTSKFYHIFGDALFGLQEHRRALICYQKALQQVSSSHNQRLHVGKKGSSLSELDQACVRFHSAKCHFILNETRLGFNMFETIPDNIRTTEMNLFIANAYYASGNEKAAQVAYKEVLKQNPFIIEAALQLIKLGTPLGELRHFLPSQLHNQSELMQDWGWLEQLLIGYSSQHHCDYNNSLEAFQTLDAQFPNNPHILEHLAQVHVHSNNPEKAVATFQKMRTIEPPYLHSIDTYASILKSQGNTLEINKLSQDALKINVYKAETWTTVAICAESKGQKDKALEFLDRALEIDERHAAALLLKGNMMLSGINAAHPQPDQALLLFKKAHAIRKDIYTFSGLVRSYVALSKMKEALAVAKECRKMMPHNPQPLTLIGLVLSQHATLRSKARQCFEEALKLDSNCLEAVLGISQLDVLDGKLKEAAALLEAHTEKHKKDFLHTRIADILVMAHRYEEATAHYNAALRLNPNCEFAKANLQRLEQIMKGEVSDAEADPNPEEEIEDEEQFA